MGKGITETLNWFYNLVLFYTCGRLCALRLYNSLCFYTTGRFYASTMLLYADCSVVLYHCTFLRPTLLLHHCTILRFYDATVRRLSVLLGLPRCKNLTRFSLFVSYCFAVRFCLTCFVSFILRHL